MADLAITFHWLPAAMDEMPVAEMMNWRTMAEKRTKAPDRPPKGKR